MCDCQAEQSGRYGQTKNSERNAAGIRAPRRGYGREQSGRQEPKVDSKRELEDENKRNPACAAGAHYFQRELSDKLGRTSL